MLMGQQDEIIGMRMVVSPEGVVPQGMARPTPQSLRTTVPSTLTYTCRDCAVGRTGWQSAAPLCVPCACRTGLYAALHTAAARGSCLPGGQALAGEEAVISEAWKNLRQEWSLGMVHCSDQDSPRVGIRSPWRPQSRNGFKLGNKGVSICVEGFVFLFLCLIFLIFGLNVFAFKLLREKQLT